MAIATPRLLRLACLVAAAIPAAFVAADEICPPIDPPAGHTAAVRAFIDPVTGKLRPATPEERRKAAAARPSRDRSGRTYELVIRPDGTRIVELDEAFSMTVTARKNADGTVSNECRTGGAAGAGSEK